MTTFKIEQPRIDQFDRDEAKMNAFRDALFGNPEPAVNLGMYVHTGSIVAADLDEVFEVGNGIPKPGTQLIRKARFSSVSVGDIITDTDTGKSWVVKGIGFEEYPYNAST